MLAGDLEAGFVSGWKRHSEKLILLYSFRETSYLHRNKHHQLPDGKADQRFDCRSAPAAYNRVVGQCTAKG